MGQTHGSIERHLLHFQTPPEMAGHSELTFHAGEHSCRVQPHTPGTLAEARYGNPLLQQLGDLQLSHYVEVDLPADQVRMLYLTHPVDVDGARTENFLSLAFHVPRDTRRRCAPQGRTFGDPGAMHPKLARLLRRDTSLSAARVLARLDAGDLEADFLADLVEPFETASALLMLHPGLINLGAESGAPARLLRDCVGAALDWRDLIVDEIENRGTRWSRRVPLRDDDGPVVDEDGPVFSAELDSRVQQLMTAPLSRALVLANQLPDLEGQSWRVHEGSTTVELDALQAARTAELRGASPRAESRWTLQALTRMNGVRTRSVNFKRPREGGWTIDTIWSSTQTPPLDGDFIAALAAGRAFVRVGVAGRERAWLGGFAAQPLPDSESVVFEAEHEASAVGADYVEITLTLDALRNDLHFALRLTNEESEEVLAAVSLGVRNLDGTERIAWRTWPATSERQGNLHVEVDNEWVRHLSLYAEYRDADGRLIDAKWRSRLPPPVARLFDAHPTRRFIEIVPPCNTVFGIPIGASTTPLDIPVPEDAVSVTLYWGGLGTGEFDETVCAAGVTCTVALDLALPVFLLLVGAAARDNTALGRLLRNPVVRASILATGGGLIGARLGLAQDPGRVAKALALQLVPTLAKSLGEAILVWLAKRSAKAAIKRSVPFINLMFTAVDSAITLAQLGQTTAAVLQSPFYYVTRLTRTFDLQVTIRPDQRFSQFPEDSARLRVQVVYDAGNSLPLSETDLLDTPLSRPITVRFDDIPAGGRLRVFVFFYTGNGWQASMGVGSWVDARGRSGDALLEIDVTVVDALRPLTKDSVYTHRRVLAYENGQHVWRRQEQPPTATIAGPMIGDDNQLLQLRGITVAQRPAQLAYAWQASGLNLPRDRPGRPSGDSLFAMQSLSLLPDPPLRRAIAPVAYSQSCGVAYDLGAAADGSGANFYLDPTPTLFSENNLTGGFHLRRIVLTLDGTPRFEPGAPRSWGRFPVAVDSFVVHPQGYIAAVNATQSKLYLLELPAAAVDNEYARMASLYSGEGDRVGLLSRPRAIAVALDGRLLVLEDGNRRIQCFDLSGNPVPYFRQAGSDAKSPLLPLRGTDATATSYLDLAVEARGFLFVLAYDGSGARPEHYRVDIYEPDGSFLVSTPQVAAARIAVDLARTMYTLNWESWLGDGGRTEPSVSVWLAPAPEQL